MTNNNYTLVTERRYFAQVRAPNGATMRVNVPGDTYFNALQQARLLYGSALVYDSLDVQVQDIKKYY